MRRRADVAPPPKPPTVPELVQAPELAALMILEHALEVAREALLAEHPTLCDDFCRPREHGRVLATANTILKRAVALRDTLRRYRSAVRDAAPGPIAKHAADDHDAIF